MTIITFASLGFVLLLCAAGAFYEHYADNLLQRVGMAGIGLANVGLMAQVWQHQGVNHACAMLAVSMAIFALGVAAKVFKFRPRPGRLPEIIWPDTRAEKRDEVHQ